MPNVISNSPIKFCCLHEELKILINLFTSFCCFMQFWINFPWWNIKEMHAQVYCTWFWGSMYLASDWVVAFWLLETLPTSQWAGPLWLYNQSTMFTRIAALCRFLVCFIFLIIILLFLHLVVCTHDQVTCVFYLFFLLDRVWWIIVKLAYFVWHLDLRLLRS